MSNFRSFRSQGDDIPPFSAGLNSVIGRNGSGKSNLLDAVQFVLLAPRFATLRQEERQALLHEGSGSAAVNAYVEIVFDNSDGRFALEHADTVVMRRTIGLHKDEFFLQRKRTTKSEIQSLLEGAGFSKSNPYFIVQQGKVQDLCTMSDTDRLTLLQQVAGTVVYDEKKLESNRLLHENTTRRTKIQSLLSDMDTRLAELESERDELQVYSQLDRHRRAVEYSLYQAEFQKARDWALTLDDEQARQLPQLAEIHDQARQTHERIRLAEASCQAIATKGQRNKRRLQDEDQPEAHEALQLYTQLQVQAKELEATFATQQEEFGKQQSQLSALETKIQTTKEQLETTVQPKCQAATDLLAEYTDQRDAAGRELEALYAKQGRQFDTKEERDASLSTTLQELQTTKSEHEETLQAQRTHRAGLVRTIDTEQQQVTQAQQQLAAQTAQLATWHKAREEQKRQRLTLHDARKEAWRTTEQLQEQVREARDAHHKTAFELKKTMPRATSQGLEALETIVEQEGLEHGKQYFGMVLDNFTLQNPKYKTAVNVAGQNALFHVIVDTDETASKLLTRLEKGKLGRVSFLPLNQLRPEPARYPDSPDVKSLLQLCIKFDRKVESAMRHVFGKKLIARSDDAAAEWSQKCRMDAITLEGSLCSSKGAVSGGYLDVRQCRMTAYVAQQKTRAALQQAQQAHHTAQIKAKQLDQETTGIVQELQTLDAKHAQLARVVEQEERQLEHLQDRARKHEQEQLPTATQAVTELERAVAALEGDIQRVQAELDSPFTKSLSEDERERLAELKELQASLGQQIEAQSEVVDKLAVERQKLQSLLQDNLLVRRKELSVSEDNRRLSSSAQQELRKDELEDCLQRLQVQTKVKESLDERVAEARALDEQYRTELLAAKNELEKLKSQDAKNAKALDDAQQKAERLANKRSMALSKRETYTRKIQELGSLPPPAEIEKVSGKSIADLMRSLESVNKKLKKYSHVNKKAFDQYVNFSEQREALLQRKDELDKGAEKVQELMESLDQQKDEAINRTFRGVRSHFKDVFRELVPNGSGELVMRTALDDGSDGDHTDAEDDDVVGDDEKKNPDVSLYRGIGIKVQFSAVGENYMMSQLSGGQKALVALALIFAIQRCDPAPFYLFDELDQALDSSYRASVADLIRRQASETQFIVSTFRPELVAASHRWFGISHQNKVSNLHELSRKDSLHFIASLMDEEEAVGEVSATASKMSRLSRKRKSSVQSRSAMEQDDDVEEEHEVATATGTLGHTDDDEESGM